MKDITLLKMADVLNDNIDISDTIISRTAINPIRFSDSIKEYFECIKDYNWGYSLLKALCVAVEEIAYYWKSEDTYNRSSIHFNNIVNTIAKYIGEENANSYLDLVKLFYNYGIPRSRINTYIEIIYNGSVATIPELIGLMMIAILLVSDAEYVDTWETRMDDGFISYVKNAINIDTSIQPMDMIAIGRLSFLPDKEKKNIVGSIWNCIIDTMARSYVLNVKGGEEHE